MIVLYATYLYLAGFALMLFKLDAEHAEAEVRSLPVDGAP